MLSTSYILARMHRKRKSHNVIRFIVTLGQSLIIFSAVSKRLYTNAAVCIQLNNVVMLTIC